MDLDSASDLERQAVCMLGEAVREKKAKTPGFEQLALCLTGISTEGTHRGRAGMC